MTNRELNKRLASLAALREAHRPDTEWVAASHARLMGAIGAPERVQRALPIRLPRTGFWPRLNFALRPVMALFLVSGFGAFGWIAGAGAMLGSVPGDALYGLKTATERAQITFTADEAAKSYLKLEFVGRRVNEVASLAEAGSAQDRSVERAVNELENGIKGIATSLQAVRAAGSDQNTTSVAKAVDRKVAEVRAVLGKTKTLLGAGAQKRVLAVESLADDVSLQAVNVLVSLAPVAPSEDVASRVQEKIDSAERKIEVASTQGADEARAAIAAAKEALRSNDYAGAMSKVQESNAIVAEELSEAVVEPVGPEAEPNGSTSTGEIRAID